jgi:hypothetical protein
LVGVVLVLLEEVLPLVVVVLEVWLSSQEV